MRTLAEHPELRKRIVTIRRKYDLPYDEHTIDEVISVVPKLMNAGTAEDTVADWRTYMDEHRDEIAAFGVLFSAPVRDQAEVGRQLTRLAAQIKDPPHRWTPEVLWRAYEKLGIARRGGGRKGVPELMAILRFELGLDAELLPYRSTIEENLAHWLARQEQQGVVFTGDQRWWVDTIAVTLASRLCVTVDDLRGVPFTTRGGVDGFVRDFGDERAESVLDELNRVLPA